MIKVLVTGSQGFIGSYLCQELLYNGYAVTGIDNYSKYGRVSRPHDSNPAFDLVELDLSIASIGEHLSFTDYDYIIAGAAMIGGIAYFHRYAYDLLAVNERILGNTFDFAIQSRKHGKLDRIVVMSSSMVFENTSVYPTPEDEIEKCPPPLSTYGFQKLACEYFAKGACQQHELPYTIVRPFNCVGTGEEDAIERGDLLEGNRTCQLSHVLPDLVYKLHKGQDPLSILGDGSQVRCYTHGGDVARGIRLAMESPRALGQSFNISNPTPTTVLELAQKIWEKMRPGQEFRWKSEPAFLYDVQKRIPDTTKATELLGFNAKIPLEQSIDEVVEWVVKSC